MLVAPSILSADFGKLQEEVTQICQAGCDLIHIDIMDGHFVPNLTFGTPVLNSIEKYATKPFDIHLMVENNSFFVDLFAPFKPKFISFHIEEEKHANRLAQKIRSYGISPAIAINPHSDLNTLTYLLEYIDMVLIMSVNPGFGGQTFIPNTLEKIKTLKQMCQKINPNCLIEVDGGVCKDNITALKECGVDIAVAGSYIFSGDYKERIASLKNC
ncbi:ribulose-phosphate 3-epimerase [Helicobacter valdiviensis]|uniref:Ribulose-phosphate 3-epimerase n=1 Tax=Helicobacter valdiviensis TaxID=1458358 RepID=A0A2W6MU45_9HELI|nr:ribulose-phosphate 3-epimerase [Helicobacter valdiviensis]PZT47439.1 ribulose-phosphate 3-epimerase [Helicobacter valdiviensis]